MTRIYKEQEDVGLDANRSAQTSIRVQLNRYLNALCYIEVAAAGPGWETAVNTRMADAILPPSLTPDEPDKARSSERVKVANHESLRVWRERNPDQEEVDHAKALLSKGGYKGLRATYPRLAQSLFPSIHASEKAWQRRIITLARLRDAIYAKYTQTQAHTIHETRPSSRRGPKATPLGQGRTLHIALVDAYQDLGVGEGLRSEVNKTDSSLILLGTIWSVNPEDLDLLLRHLQVRIHQIAAPALPGAGPG
jgi:hypothetical protein